MGTPNSLRSEEKKRKDKEDESNYPIYRKFIHLSTVDETEKKSST